MEGNGEFEGAGRRSGREVKEVIEGLGKGWGCRGHEGQPEPRATLQRP